MDADAAIYADKKSLETRFSHRTRVLDHFWMELPTICSAGDYISDVIAEKGIGIVVPERSASQFAKAILSLKTDRERYQQIKKNLHETKDEFTWEKTLHPLLDYLSSAKAAKVPTIPTTPDISPEPPKLAMKQRIKRSAKILLLGR
jgi:glycosyltransferase involved in cell wall biosynthesis